jgi:hypothetical protein
MQRLRKVIQEERLNKHLMLRPDAADGSQKG